MKLHYHWYTLYSRKYHHSHNLNAKTEAINFLVLKNPSPHAANSTIRSAICLNRLKYLAPAKEKPASSTSYPASKKAD